MKQQNTPPDGFHAVAATDQGDRQFQSSWAIAPLMLVFACVLLGILLRGINLADKVYWVDEVHTTVRVAGYTRDQVQARLFDQGMLTAADLKDYQAPTVKRSWGDTLSALQRHPEHAPLYFVLGRVWTQGMAIAHRVFHAASPIDSVLSLRSLSVLLGLGLLPAIYWLGRAGFGVSPVGTRTTQLAIALMALSPLHVLYAQEARQYSLWSVSVVVSCAALWQALHYHRWRNWGLYGASVVLGLYSHLLFGLVAIAQGLCILWVQKKLGRSGPLVLRRYGVVGLGSLVAFSPWLVALVRALAQVEQTVDATQRSADFNYLLNVWLRNLSRVFFSMDLGTANLIVAAFALYALWMLWRQSPSHVGLLIVAVVAGSALPLMVADGITGGISSTRIRYLIPAYVGIQVAIAHLLAQGLVAPKVRSRRLWAAIAALFLGGMGVASLMDAGQAVNWTKSDKAAYYPAIADAINRGDRPLVVSDSSPTYVLALSRLIDNEVMFQLVTRPSTLELDHPLTHPFGDIFVFDPSKRLQQALTQQHGYELEVVVEQNSSFQLLHAISTHAYADSSSPQFSDRSR